MEFVVLTEPVGDRLIFRTEPDTEVGRAPADARWCWRCHKLPTLARVWCSIFLQSRLIEITRRRVHPG